ncbi:hypothetical protein EXIGLDRAFT_732471 [Exidia glandulosa HHB12029]|uniref:F-box domain-containing protein n=1 Tax=Exidia glandulosa HHB12029 TaxID=1314781 RepID=A0A165BHU4_EXIGL|nr:hypothetical protein EXIGLDRAFT_732471 [Exidia glandulosa HHB12029]
MGSQPVLSHWNTIPGDLQWEIARYCDRATVIRLCVLQRSWSATCSPALYSTITLKICKHSDVHRAIACARTLLIPTRSTLVRRLTIDSVPDHDVFESSRVALSALNDALKHLHSLQHLSIQSKVSTVADDIALPFTIRRLMRTRAFNLVTLTLPSRYIAYDGALFYSALEAQLDTLEMLVHSGPIVPGQLGWTVLRRAAQAGCIVLQYDPQAGSRLDAFPVFVTRELQPHYFAAVSRFYNGPPDLKLSLWISAPEDIASTLAALSMTFATKIESLGLFLQVEVEAPDILLDPDNVADGLVRFRQNLRDVQFSTWNDQQIEPSLEVPTPTLVELASLARARGCLRLLMISLNNQRICRRDRLGFVEWIAMESPA